MKSYRVKVRDEKAEFFEELLRYLDFCDYEKVEGFAEPRIYPSFEIRSKDGNHKQGSKNSVKGSGGKFADTENSLENLREVMSRIDALRDRSRKG
ncbi:hypothetical protein [Natronoflexus pectinivorans]|uniref:Uncharacterized protein n=1 Tax=Natronoflexus pectinivorans TaxID=682526 RepID=A0A4R2GKI1_9BACT|nr:hypothetical protein [Natronoflexus pectinivorans]TCO09292.1 hypothetical protein EV194_103204 [Natronoflexus pectinivorans]